jgi:hypothetical protein
VRLGGFAMGNVRLWASSGDRAWVLSDRGAGGALTLRGLYTTDGTSSGTMLVQELTSLRLTAVGPFDYGELEGGRLLLTVDDPLHGIEPWVLNPEAVAQTLGAPCVSRGLVVPRLRAVGEPRVGRTVDLLAEAVGAPVGWLLLGLPAAAPVVLPGRRCSLALDPLQAAVVGPLATGASGGSIRVPLRIPASSGLVGVRVVAQAVFPNALAPSEADLSAGLLLQVGR